MGVSGQHHAPAALYPRGKDPGTHWRGGWVGPRAGLDTEDRGKIRCPCQGSNPDRPVVQPVVRHYTDWATRLHCIYKYCLYTVHNKIFMSHCNYWICISFIIILWALNYREKCILGYLGRLFAARGYLGRLFAARGYLSRSQWQRGLRRRSAAACCWDRGFESRSGHGTSSVTLSCVGRGLCDGPITRPEESYRVFNCVWTRNPERETKVQHGL
jgi:hypothetical protein